MIMKKYFNTLFIAVVAFSLLTLVFNWFVDPYALFNDYSERESNKKPELVGQLRLHKLIQIEQNKYDFLILGSSRALRSINPIESFFNGYSAYNLALTGARINEYIYYLSLANKMGSVKRVIVFLDFNQDEDIEAAENEIEERRFMSGYPRLEQRFIDVKDVLFSVRALKDSFKTYGASGKGDRISSLGFSDIKRPKNDEKKFRRIEESHLDRLTHGGGIDNLQHGRYAMHYEKLLRYLYANDIQVELIISPLHARFIETIVAANRLASFESWKKMLVQVNKVVATSLNSRPFSVWDHAIYNGPNTERVVEGVPAQWYYESSHAKPLYGQWLLSELAGKANESLGVKLTEVNVDEHLAMQRLQREEYVAKNHSQLSHIWRRREILKAN